MEGGRKGGPRDFEKSSHALKASRIKIKSAALSIHHHPLLSSPLLSCVHGTRYVFHPRGGRGRDGDSGGRRRRR